MEERNLLTDIFANNTEHLVRWYAQKRLKRTIISIDEADRTVGKAINRSSRAIANWRSGRSKPHPTVFDEFIDKIKEVGWPDNVNEAEYREAWSRQRDDNSDEGGSVDGEDNRIKESLYTLAAKEDRDIKNRLKQATANQKKLTTDSMTHINCFGWVAASG